MGLYAEAHGAAARYRRRLGDQRTPNPMAEYWYRNFNAASASRR